MVLMVSLVLRQPGDDCTIPASPGSISRYSTAGTYDCNSLTVESGGELQIRDGVEIDVL